MNLPKGWSADIDVANRRFRICVDAPKATGDDRFKALPVVCSPWIQFDDVADELRRAGHNIAAEGGRFWDRVRGWFGGKKK